MKNSNFKALWDFIFLSGGEIIGKVAGLITFAYLARTLGPTAYGSVEAALALLAVFTLLVQFGFGPIGAREISRNPASINSYARLIPGCRLILALIAVPSMWLIAEVMGDSNQTKELIFITAFALFGIVWNQSWLFQGMEKMHLVSLSQALKMLFHLCLVVLFVKSTGDLINVAYIEVGSAAITAFYFLILQRASKVPIGIRVNTLKAFEMIRETAAVGASNVVWALNQYLPTLLVALLIGGASTAWLGSAHRIVNAIITFSMLYHFNLFPAVAYRLQHSALAFERIVWPSFRVTAWIGIAIALAVTLFAKWISIVIFGEGFVEAALPMSVLVWSLPLTLLNGHARWALIAKGKQRYVLYAQLSGTIATIIIGLALIPQYGPLGGAVAMVFCSGMVWLVAHFYAINKVAPIPSIDIVWRPICLAILILLLINQFGDESVILSIVGIVIFIFLAPILDKLLINDIQELSKIKNDRNFNIEEN
jgi:O-antigen/teichoic acid export membrane protein